MELVSKYMYYRIITTSSFESLVLPYCTSVCLSVCVCLNQTMSSNAYLYYDMRILLIYIIHTESKRKVCDIKKDVSTCVCDTERERGRMKGGVMLIERYWYVI